MDNVIIPYHVKRIYNVDLPEDIIKSKTDVDIKKVVKELSSLGCKTYMFNKLVNINNINDIIYGLVDDNLYLLVSKYKRAIQSVKILSKDNITLSLNGGGKRKAKKSKKSSKKATKKMTDGAKHKTKKSKKTTKKMTGGAKRKTKKSSKKTKKASKKSKKTTKKMTGGAKRKTKTSKKASKKSSKKGKGKH